MSVIKRMPLSWFILPEQSRKDLGSEDDLRNLGKNIRDNGQLSLVGAIDTGEVIWGHRRVHGAKLEGLEYLETKIFERGLSQLEILRLNFSENIHRLDLSGYEKWNACEELRRLSPSWTAKDLAEYLQLDPSAVTKLLSPSKCIPPWQEALKEGHVGIGDCYQASQAVSEEQQRELLEMKLAGASRDTLARAVRRTKVKSEKETVRATRVAVPLHSGSRVVISGKGLSLADVVETLIECLDAARKGVKEHLDAKTWQNVMRDKAVAAGGGPTDV